MRPRSISRRSGKRARREATKNGAIELEDEDDVVDVVPNTELLVLSESYSSDEGPSAARQTERAQQQKGKMAAEPLSTFTFEGGCVEDDVKRPEDPEALEAPEASAPEAAAPEAPEAPAPEAAAPEAPQAPEAAAPKASAPEAAAPTEAPEATVAPEVVNLPHVDIKVQTEAAPVIDEDIVAPFQAIIAEKARRRRLERLAWGVEVHPPTEKWECSACSEVNKASRQRCNNCTARAPWLPDEVQVEDGDSSSSEQATPKKQRHPSLTREVLDSPVRSVGESPPRSIPGSSPRSVPDESEAEQVDLVDDVEPQRVVELGSDAEQDDLDCHLESLRVSGELAEARARIYHNLNHDDD